MPYSSSLETLHQEIAVCHACREHGLDVQPSAITFRGSGNKVMIVGIEPGNNELESGAAFTGQAGKRLLSWLEEAGLGNSREEIFSNAYFTSLLKCKRADGVNLTRCYKQCRPFLHQQIRLIKPEILITLGSEPMKHLFGSRGSLDECVGNSYTESEMRGYADLTPLLEPESIIIPLPHPSPLSHWLNKTENRVELGKALNLIRERI